MVQHELRMLQQKVGMLQRCVVLREGLCALSIHEV